MYISPLALAISIIIIAGFLIFTIINYIEFRNSKNRVSQLEKEMYSKEKILLSKINDYTESVRDYVDTLHDDSVASIRDSRKYTDSLVNKLDDKFKKQLVSSVDIRNALDKVDEVDEKLTDFIRNYRNN